MSVFQLRASLILFLASIGCVNADLGPYQFRETSIAGNDIREGTLLLLEADQITIANDARVWSRMPIVWATARGRVRAGTLGSGGTLEIRGTFASVLHSYFEVFEDGQLLGRVEPLQGQSAAQAAKTFAALPTFKEMVERATMCFSEFDELLPNYDTFRDTNPQE
jgi:hypothetical protein